MAEPSLLTLQLPIFSLPQPTAASPVSPFQGGLMKVLRQVHPETLITALGAREFLLIAGAPPPPL